MFTLCNKLFCAECRTFDVIFWSPRVEKCSALGKTLCSALSLFTPPPNHSGEGAGQIPQRQSKRRNISNCVLFIRTIPLEPGSVQLQLLNQMMVLLEMFPRPQNLVNPHRPAGPSSLPRARARANTRPCANFLHSVFVDNTNYLRNQVLATIDYRL